MERVGVESPVIDLHGPAASSPERAGHKAANLARLAAAGFPVPEGVVVTAEAWAAAHGGGASAASLPPQVLAALEAALAGLGDVPLAVRSSGVGEDLAGASFAGQYKSFLNVRGLAAVADAVCSCWASAHASHAVAYGSRQKVQLGRMAVLIQRLVLADAAAVAFTVNPVTGDPNEVVVNAVKGLGDRLVSGLASPDEWVVRQDEARAISAPEGAIDASQARAVADLARRVADHFASPQDVEWAISNGKLFLLQARPITTLPAGARAETIESVALPVNPPPGFWEREGSHYPLPLYPITRSAFLPLVNKAFRRACAEFPMLLETIELREIGGHVYQRVVPPGGKDRPAPPDWLWSLMVKVVPPIRVQIKRCEEVMQSDKAGRFIERWYDEWKPMIRSRIAELRRVDRASLSDADLDRHIQATAAFLDESFQIHMMLNLALNFMLAEFAFACQELLGWDDRKCFDLVSGLSETSSEPARALAALARRVQQSPTACRLLRQVGDDTIDRLAEAEPELYQAFVAYQEAYGCRAIRYDVAYPTMEERPELILRIIQDQIHCGHDPEDADAAVAAQRLSTVADARGMLAGQSASDFERFERTLRRAERAYPVREEHGFFDAAGPLALCRYACLEASRRLVERGKLARVDDFWFLDLDELRAALRGDSHAPLNDTITRRKGERAWALANPGPASYGRQFAPPSLAVLPPVARAAHEAVTWILERTFATAQSGLQQQANAGAIKGIAAASGTYTGTVRVIKDEDEFGKIQPGDVLVCPITSPVWSVLFPSVGALVTDTGGILSHAAIIAREFRIPAVVATGNATQLLRDGQVVTVDGSGGLVVLEATQVNYAGIEAMSW